MECSGVALVCELVQYELAIRAAFEWPVACLVDEETVPDTIEANDAFAFICVCDGVTQISAPLAVVQQGRIGIQKGGRWEEDAVESGAEAASRCRGLALTLKSMLRVPKPRRSRASCSLDSV